MTDTIALLYLCDIQVPNRCHQRSDLQNTNITWEDNKQAHKYIQTVCTPNQFDISMLTNKQIHTRLQCSQHSIVAIS
jgi:hypothetical protein